MLLSDDTVPRTEQIFGVWCYGVRVLLVLVSVLVSVLVLVLVLVFTTVLYLIRQNYFEDRGLDSIT
jgi:hypothetical protein